MSQVIDVELLGDLIPIKELGPPHRSRLAQGASLDEVPAGTKLSAAKEQANLLYLIDGELALASVGRAAGHVSAGSARARLPVFSDRAGNDFAVCEAPSMLLRLDKALFSELLNKEHLAGYEVVSDVDVSQTESRLFEQLYQAYHAKQLELPPMPEVALQIKRMADDPDIDITQVARVVQSDPAVAGAIMHAANSPLFRGSSPVSTLKDAVVRLGLKTTRNLAMSLAMRATFQSNVPSVKQRVRKVWERSVTVSALSYAIARRCGAKFDPERALLAGLLHDIGSVPILNYVAKHRLEHTPEELDEILTKLQTMVGVLVLNYWGFDQELITVVEESSDWAREAGPEPDYCDLVLVARLCSRLDPQQSAALPALDQVPAVRRLGLGGLDEDGSLEVLREVESEVQGIKQLLAA
ncbi:MAG: HDOD domain-containing protein [Chromatiales bacterium]|jgi:HD-like signal output (HDOD) protein